MKNKHSEKGAKRIEYIQGKRKKNKEREGEREKSVFLFGQYARRKLQHGFFPLTKMFSVAAFRKQQQHPRRWRNDDCHASACIPRRKCKSTLHYHSPHPRFLLSVLLEGKICSHFCSTLIIFNI